MVNAQLGMSTTSKYNFPLPEQSLQFPQHLIELSIRSLKPMQPLQLSFEDCQTSVLSLTKTPTFIAEATKLVKLKPDYTKIPLAAIDVSSIRLGETERGILLALRGAIVWKQDSRYRYLRLGPFPFHITRKTQMEICSLLHHHQQPTYLHESSVPNHLYLQSRLTSLLERWIQTSINNATHQSLILWDGSLTAGTPETTIEAMTELLKEARTRKNTILAFSKNTRLLFNGRRLSNLILEHQPPCILQIHDRSMYEGALHLMGNIYVVRLTGGACAFRMDVDKELPHLQVVESVQKLLGNDLISQSYPETLRLAHIFSTFTATEVLGIQRYLAKEKRIKILGRQNVRRMLFGPFGKGLEG